MYVRTENAFIGSVEYCNHVQYTLSDLIVKAVIDERID